MPSDIDHPFMVRLKRHAMGCEFEVVLAGADPDFLEQAGLEALDEVEQLDRQLSHYRLDSEISYINASAAIAPVRVEPRLFELLQRAVQLSSETEGAFDITIGPLVKLRENYRKEGVLPPEDAVSQCLELVGMQHLRLDAEWNTVSFARAGMAISLGAIGKGYAVDRAVEILHDCGVENALIHGGFSTVYALGSPPDGEHWLVGLRHPEEPVSRIGAIHLHNEALSTSGGYEQFYIVEGKRQSHLLDPKTGFSSETMLSSSVISRSATDSDALSTAFFIMGIERASQYCSAHPEIRALLISHREGDELQITQLGSPDILEESDGKR